MIKPEKDFVEFRKLVVKSPAAIHLNLLDKCTESALDLRGKLNLLAADYYNIDAKLDVLDKFSILIPEIKVMIGVSLVFQFSKLSIWVVYNFFLNVSSSVEWKLFRYFALSTKYPLVIRAQNEWFRFC